MPEKIAAYHEAGHVVCAVAADDLKSHVNSTPYSQGGVMVSSALGTRVAIFWKLSVPVMLVLANSITPLFAQESRKNAAPVEQNNQRTTVISEGVGANPDEALKNAYRNAVRQVVGAVVDAETLVNNDEVIDDKVLTYSDGFIKSYEEVTGSKKIKGGLHRIKIKAQVERRSVVAKLKAANISMKKIDGDGLFAEVVTQLDAEKDAAALLKKQFEGFPQSCITATVIGKPEILEKQADKATVKITVQIEPDLKAYKAFSTRLTPILGKLAKTKGEFTGKFGRYSSNKSTPYLEAIADGRYSNIELLAAWMPKVFERVNLNTVLKKDVLTLAVATHRTKAADRIDFNAYQIDYALQPILVELATRKGQCKLQLLNDEGEIIVTERFRLYSGGFAGTLVSAYGPYINGRHIYELGLSVCNEHETEYRISEKNARLFLLSPTFFMGLSDKFYQLPQLTIPCTLTLGLDELKSVQDAKVEIIFDE